MSRKKKDEEEGERNTEENQRVAKREGCRRRIVLFQKKSSLEKEKCVGRNVRKKEIGIDKGEG